MLEELIRLMPVVADDLAKLSNSGETGGWDSLIINRRKPHTYRIFKKFGDLRVCLHKFEPCESDEAFQHPHPWPGAFVVLEGSYEQSIGYSPSFEKDSKVEPVFREKLVAGSMYEIVNPLTWHSVRPLETTYTMMVNGPEFDKQHGNTVTTKGKDLEKMTENELVRHFCLFWRLLDDLFHHRHARA